MKRFLSTGILVALAVLATRPTINAQVAEKPEALDYEVYSAVANEFCVRRSCRFVLIIDHTVSAKAANLDLMETDGPELMEDFARKNASSSSFQSGFKLFEKYDLISDEDSSATSVSSVPIISFSRIGFSKNRDKALVFFSARGSKLTKVEQFIVLSKDSTGWKVVKSVVRLLAQAQPTNAWSGLAGE